MGKRNVSNHSGNHNQTHARMSYQKGTCILLKVATNTVDKSVMELHKFFHAINLHIMRENINKQTYLAGSRHLKH